MNLYRKLLIGTMAALVAGGAAAVWGSTASGSAAWAGPGSAANNAARAVRQPANPHPKAAGPLAPIDTSTESRYTPITQCRVVDTRARAAGGKVTPGTVRSWHVSGTAGFPAQGGHNGGCGIPTSATAVTAVIQSISAAGAGDLHLWPFGTPEPAKIFFNYTNAYNVSNTATFQINPAGAKDISVRAERHATHLVIDVTGYFIKPMYAYVNPDGSVNHGSRVTGGSHPFPGTYEVDFDRDVSGCTYHVTPGNLPYWVEAQPREGNPDAVFVASEAGDGPLTDVGFYLTVTC